NFPCAAGTLNPGDGCSFAFEATLSTTDGMVTNITNSVTATGCTITQPSICTNAITNAVATIIPAKVACTKCYTIDGGLVCTNNTCIADSLPHTIVWFLTVTNEGVANLVDVHVTDTGLGCTVDITNLDLDSGASTTFPICTNASFVCSNGLGIANDV